MNTLFFDDPELTEIQHRLTSTDSAVRRIAIIDLADFPGDEHVPLIAAAFEFLISWLFGSRSGLTL